VQVASSRNIADPLPPRRDLKAACVVFDSTTFVSTRLAGTGVPKRRRAHCTSPSDPRSSIPTRSSRACGPSLSLANSAAGPLASPDDARRRPSARRRGRGAPARLGRSAPTSSPIGSRVPSTATWRCWRSRSTSARSSWPRSRIRRTGSPNSAPCSSTSISGDNAKGSASAALVVPRANPVTLGQRLRRRSRTTGPFFRMVGPRPPTGRGCCGPRSGSAGSGSPSC
jgi:hypothetical protein